MTKRPAEGGTQMHIGALIVDDEEDIRELIRLVIEAANQGLFVAGEAADGQEAIARVQETDPAVIVLDERMPVLGGLETAKAILEKRPGQRIILCSAYLDPELRRRAEAVGITVCLMKSEIPRIPEALFEVASTG